MPSTLTPPRRTVISLLAAASFAPLVHAQTVTSDKARIEELEQRLLVLERKLEIQGEESATKAKEAPVVAAGDKGFSLKNAKGDYGIQFTALAQVDHRAFLEDEGTLEDGFFTRRLRPTLQGHLGKLVAFRFTPEFAGANGAGDSASIIDAYFDLKFSPYASFRIGKQKGPVGLERLQSGGALHFIERGFPTELAPNRDLGVTLYGETAKTTLSYALGVYNGTADGRDVATNDDGNKEFAARVFFEPFKNDYSAFKGLGFGIAATTGNKDTTAIANAAATLPRYRTPGQQQFFGYEAGAAATGTTAATPAVIANGKHTRYSPQAYFYRRNYGLLAEYVVSQQELSRGAANLEAEHSAYQLVASYVLTGEDASFRGVKPASAYTIGGPGWGAVEVVARIGQLDIDDDVFTGTAATRFANLNSNPTEANTYGVGVNWHLTQNARLTTDYNVTTFDRGAAAGADRRDEKALFSRLTIQY